MTTTREALVALRAKGAPVPLLDFVAWAGPWLEASETPEAFFATYQLAIADLAEGRAGLHGSLVRRPIRQYRPLTLAAGVVADAFRGPEFGRLVHRLQLEQV